MADNAGRPWTEGIGRSHQRFDITIRDRDVALEDQFVDSGVVALELDLAFANIVSQLVESAGASAVVDARITGADDVELSLV